MVQGSDVYLIDRETGDDLLGVFDFAYQDSVTFNLEPGDYSINVGGGIFGDFDFTVYDIDNHVTVGIYDAGSGVAEFFRTSY